MHIDGYTYLIYSTYSWVATSGWDNFVIDIVLYLVICSVQPNPRRQLNLDVDHVDQSSALVMISSAFILNTPYTHTCSMVLW